MVLTPSIRPREDHRRDWPVETLDMTLQRSARFMKETRIVEPGGASLATPPRGVSLTRCSICEIGMRRLRSFVTWPWAKSGRSTEAKGLGA